VRAAPARYTRAMAPTFDAAALTGLRRVGALAASPDGTWLAAAVQRLDDDAYVSALGGIPRGGGPARPLTHGPSKDRAPRFRSDGGLLFLSDRAEPGASPDDTRTQVWLLPAGGGEPERLTDEPLGVAEVRPLGAGTDLALLVEVWPGVADADQRAHDVDRTKHGPTALRYRDLPARHWDAWLPATALHLVVHAGGARRDLTPDAGHELRNRPAEAVLEVSPAGDRIAVAWGRLGADRVPDSWARVIEVATGAATDLDAAPATFLGDVRFSPDGRHLAAVRYRRARGKAEVTRLVVFDGAGGDGRIVSDWDSAPTLWAWTRDGTALLVTADHEGDCPVWRVDVAGGEVARITAEGVHGSHGAILALPDGRIAGVRHGILQPPEPFVCEQAPGATPRLLAAIAGLGADDARAIATWESRWTEGDGGTPVQYFLARPATGAGPHPLLLWIHGGPISQTADGWHWRWNVLAAVAAGYAVALPNPRGSTGRGQQFADEVQGNQWGGACYRDLMAVTDDVAARPGIDGGRMIAMGGSFGGYMVNWIGTQTDRFRAIVSHAGIFDFPAFHGASDYPAWFAIEMGVSPDGDPAAFGRFSPRAHAGGWKTPVLILHGEKDYRVPVSEALIMFEALRGRGIDAELVVFPDENHWIMRPRNVRAWYDAWTEFCRRHVA
jgi:dipeptidyl aminopeptidase/acylaminoacyl peptidase